MDPDIKEVPAGAQRVLGFEEEFETDVEPRPSLPFGGSNLLTAEHLFFKGVRL